MFKQIGFGMVASSCWLLQAANNPCCCKENACVQKCCNKIKVVNLGEVYNQFYPAQEAQKNFDLLIKQANEEHEKMMKEGKPLFEQRDALLKKLETPSLSDKAKKDLEEQLSSVVSKIQEQGRKIGQFQHEKEEKMNEQRQTILAKHFKELNEVIARIAKEEDLDLILNEASALYVKPSFQLTQKVIEVANQPYQKQIEAEKKTNQDKKSVK